MRSLVSCCKPGRHRLTTRALKRSLSAHHSPSPPHRHHRATRPPVNSSDTTRIPYPLYAPLSSPAFTFTRVVACPYDAPHHPPPLFSCHLIRRIKGRKVHKCMYLLYDRNTIPLSFPSAPISVRLPTDSLSLFFKKLTSAV